MQRLLLILLFVTSTEISFAQDKSFTRWIIFKLSGHEFWGRGYTKNGVNKTSKFLVSEFKSLGLWPLSGNNFRQKFTFPVNTFPGAMSLKINGRILSPGRDFIVAPESRGLRADGELSKKDSTFFINATHKFGITLSDVLTWSVSSQVADYTSIIVNKKAIAGIPATFETNIKNRFIKSFESSNICAVVKGTVRPDSLILITAHYDHLGGMGREIYFPGANDNASGVALLLQLAKYYVANPQKYSMAFICFSGEEAGLLGSKYFIENPLIDLKKVRFLINTDLAGTGEEGIMVVNGSVFKNEFNLLSKINDQEKYLVKINSRGKAANSDHYWFTEKGVPSFFIYTMGGIRAYHDIYDKSDTLPLTEHEDLFRLIVKFNQALMN